MERLGQLGPTDRVLRDTTAARLAEFAEAR
jgi:hypothetical protein